MQDPCTRPRLRDQSGKNQGRGTVAAHGGGGRIPNSARFGLTVPRPRPPMLWLSEQPRRLAVFDGQRPLCFTTPFLVPDVVLCPRCGPVSPMWFRVPDVVPGALGGTVSGHYGCITSPLRTGNHIRDAEPHQGHGGAYRTDSKQIDIRFPVLECHVMNACEPKTGTPGAPGTVLRTGNNVMELLALGGGDDAGFGGGGGAGPGSAEAGAGAHGRVRRTWQ